MEWKLAGLKPGVPRKIHLLAAALLWSGIGLMLMLRGMRWLMAAHLVVLAVPAVILGLLKARFVLERIVEKNVERIRLFRDGTCLGAVYSKKTWGLVLVMIGMGIFLRNSAIPRPVIAVVYIMVGWALLWASRKGWEAWRDWR